LRSFGSLGVVSRQVVEIEALDGEGHRVVFQ
jgi:hypothetical protein